MITTAIGCSTTPPPPAGPGAASATDLSAWTADAPTITVAGQLLYFSCASQEGVYFTWSVNPKGPERPCELDIRACPNDAKLLENQQVIITGKFIDRQPRHLPLVVVEHIAPATSDKSASQSDQLY